MNVFKRVRKVILLGNEMVKLEVMDLNNKPHYFEVKESDFEKYCNGEMIQKCFPYLNKDEREIFISGMTSEMWDSMFGKSEF